MDPVARQLTAYLNALLQNPAHPPSPPQNLPAGWEALEDTLALLAENLLDVHTFAADLARGNLNAPLPPAENELAAPLKTLHASLRHLTWQTQQVAKGDYQQRVDFMGDFSHAFNTMTDQLEQQRTSLIEEIEHWRSQNHTLAQNKNLYEWLVGQIAQWIVVADATTAERLFFSREMCEVVGSPAVEAQLDLWLAEQTALMQGQNEVQTTELELRDEEGGAQFYSVSIHPLRWQRHRALAFVLTDISQERKNLISLQNIAHYDTLTQTYNRHYGMETLNAWVAEGNPFILCFVDIDNLKKVNDCYGHSQGDQYIIRVCGILREFSPEAIVCRIGGDEFMILDQSWNLDEANARMEHLRTKLMALRGNSFYQQSISYGIIPVPKDERMLPSDLLRAADEKMYAYKRTYKRRTPPDGPSGHDTTRPPELR